MSIIYDFIGIGAIEEFNRKTKLVQIKNPISFSDNRSDYMRPFRTWQEENDKKWIVYRKENGKWIRVASTYAGFPNAVAQFIHVVLHGQEGDYLFNTGANSRTSYLFSYDGRNLTNKNS